MNLAELLRKLEVHATEVRHLLAGDRRRWEARDPERVKRRLARFLAGTCAEPLPRIRFDAEGGWRIEGEGGWRIAGGGHPG